MLDRAILKLFGVTFVVVRVILILPPNSRMSQFQYCDLTRHDLPELRALQGRLFPVNHTTEFNASLLSVDVISILAFHNDKMVGVATGRVRPCKFRLNKYHGYITTLGVDADYRRH